MVPGCYEFIEEAVKHFEVNIFSSRSNQFGGIVAMQNFFYFNIEESIVDQLVFPTVKPPAMIGLDDRVLLFTGKWPDMQTLINFKPWNKE